jgi:hypothetical protein
MIRFQQEIQSMLEKDPKFTEMADYMNSKIQPMLAKLNLKPSRQWDNLILKIAKKAEENEAEPDAHVENVDTFSLGRFYEQPESWRQKGR